MEYFSRIKMMMFIMVVQVAQCESYFSSILFNVLVAYWEENTVFIKIIGNLDLVVNVSYCVDDIGFFLFRGMRVRKILRLIVNTIRVLFEFMKIFLELDNYNVSQFQHYVFLNFLYLWSITNTSIQEICNIIIKFQYCTS